MSELRKALLGCALGDSLGLPFETLSKKKATRLFRNKLRQSLIFGKGMLSDDTEHSIFVIIAFLRSSNADEYRIQMRKLLRRWLLTIPCGVGFGTLKAIMKMYFGIQKSATGSAGNGPLMKTAVLAVLLKDRPDELEDYVRVNTELTHGDPRAFESSLVFARLVQRSFAGLHVGDLEESRGEVSEEFGNIIDKMCEFLKLNKTPDEFAEEMGFIKGISGYTLHTFAGAVYPAIYFKGDFEKTLSWIICAGGDTDSVGAVAGALIANMPNVELPQIHIDNLKDWPLSVGTRERLADKKEVPSFLFLRMLLRNLFFIPYILLIAIVRIFR